MSKQIRKIQKMFNEETSNDLIEAFVSSNSNLLFGQQIISARSYRVGLFTSPTHLQLISTTLQKFGHNNYISGERSKAYIHTSKWGFNLWNRIRQHIFENNLNNL